MCEAVPSGACQLAPAGTGFLHRAVMHVLSIMMKVGCFFTNSVMPTRCDRALPQPRSGDDDRKLPNGPSLRAAATRSDRSRSEQGRSSIWGAFSVAEPALKGCQSTPN
jgi:hypothetical protein